MNEWLNDYIEIELNKIRDLKVCSTLRKILDEGYTKTDINLKHFDVYEKGNKRILYNPSSNLIDMIYDAKKVFEVTLETYVSSEAKDAPIPYYGWHDNPNIRWVSVPPETSLKCLLFSSEASDLAFSTICF